MGRAFTAEANVCTAERQTANHSGTADDAPYSMRLLFLLTKNLLFWGSAALSIYLIYSLISAL